MSKRTIFGMQNSLFSRKQLGRMVLLAAAALACASPTIAQELSPSDKNPDRQREKPLSPERQELRDRFEQRLDRIETLKDSGVVGETWQGYLDALDVRLLSDDERAVVDAENRDRKTLYTLVSKDRAKGRTSVPVRVVAERNAARKFEAAANDQYLMIAEGRWIQKRDQKRAETIARLKNDGVVGETWDGWLEAVGGDVDQSARRIIDIENRNRRAMYDEIAGRIRKVSADDIARDAAESIEAHMPTGGYFKSRDGRWARRSAGS